MALDRKDITRKSHLKRHYDMTLEEYDQLWDSQEGVCAICGNPETRYYNSRGVNARLAVDHDHVTGQIRGLLCARCNSVLGTLENIGIENFTSYL